MHRLTVAVAAAMLALPAGAIAAPTRGVVLSVDAGHHTIQVVNGKHLVSAYRFRGGLPRLRPGSRISFARKGHTIARVHAGPGKTVSFYSRVVRANANGVTLRVADGGTVRFSAKQISAVLQRVKTHWSRWRSVRRAALHTNTAASTLSLVPGAIVLVTETRSNGQTTVTVTLPAATPTSSAPTNQGTGAGQTGGHPTGNGDASGGDVVGTITQLSQTAVTINANGRSMTFTCDPADDLTEGFAVGDLIDVTYDTSSGSAVASDVEYVEADATGTVTAVGSASLTLADGDTGQTQTITADPAEDMFDGVSVNDEVVVTYHQSAGQLIADVVDDETAGY